MERHAKEYEDKQLTDVATCSQGSPAHCPRYVVREPCN
jgi:hypothetical protein